MENLIIDYDSQDYITQWVQTSWASVAANAYRLFLEHGRGAVLVDFKNATATADFHGGLRARWDYIPLEHLEGAGGEEIVPGLLERVRGYDPEREVVYIFQRRKAGPLFGHFGKGWTSPKELFEQQPQRDLDPPEIQDRRFGMG